MSLHQAAAEISAKLEYPACPLCGSDRREFPFRLSAIGQIRRGEHEPYGVARCIECGLHYLYPRLIERDAGSLSSIVVLRRWRMRIRGHQLH
jgi:hypothetical protein